MTEAEEIAEVMAELGFEYEYLAGGCEAYQLKLPGDPEDFPYILVSSPEARLPKAWDDPILVGKYAFYGDDDATYEEFDTVRAFIDAVRAGRSLVPKPAVTSAPVAPVSVDPSDLETINRHREGLGMPPIDVSGGWTEEELREMARQIKATGRMHNAATLKRRLLR